jgi:hypothetical protein
MKLIVGLILLAWIFSIIDLDKLIIPQKTYNSHINNGVSELKRTEYYKLISNQKSNKEDNIIENITFED